MCCHKKCPVKDLILITHIYHHHHILYHLCVKMLLIIINDTHLKEMYQETFSTAGSNFGTDILVLYACV